MDYFVNDASTNGDCYATAPGDDTNTGTSAASPKLTLTNLLATYTLAPGDTMYVDTGIYPNYTVQLTSSGVATNPIVIKGSTNYQFGGTILRRALPSADVLVLNGDIKHVRVSDLRVEGGRYGVYFSAFITGPISNEFIRVVAVSNQNGFALLGGSYNVFKRCVAANNSRGMRTLGSSQGLHARNTWDHGISWSNGTAFDAAWSDTISVSNSIIVGGTAHTVIPQGADYNIYWSGSLGAGHNFLQDLQDDHNHSFRSTYADPALASPEAMDFHPQSASGRFDPVSNAYVVTDTNYSPAIDLGNPSATFTNEPAPNGGVLNVGMFGNSAEASKSRTNAWLFCLSYNDGGNLVASGRFYWAFGGAFSNNATAQIQYSVDAGVVWSNVVSGIPVTNRSYLWTATGAVSSLRTLWRIRADGNTNVLDACNTNFVLRNSTNTVFSLYVNDASTAGDVYCLAPGSVTNSGLAPNQPMAAVQDALDTYDLGLGDVIFVDTGIYTNPVTVTSLDQGENNRFVTIQGSTNVVAGGTIMDRRNPTGDVLILRGVSKMRFADFSARGGRYGVFFDGNFGDPQSNQFARISAVSNSIGFSFLGGLENSFVQCVAAKNGIGFGAIGSSQSRHISNTWDLGVLFSNSSAFSVFNNMVSVSNSVIVGGTAYAGGAVPTKGDYNVYWQTIMGGGFGNLNELQKSLGHDWHSTIGDPRFANVNSLDFHPLSTTGRYNVATGLFVNDTNTSMLVDLGDPGHSFSNEPAPNGGRVNVGSWGDHRQASKSPTNNWLLALTYNDGGTLSVPGDVIYWASGNIATGAKVRIEYSADSGSTWSIAETGLLASAGSYTWANTNFSSSLFARWRVVLESNTNVLDATDADLVFRNGPFKYYINDATLGGDVYTTAVGSDTNLGTSVGSPKLTLQSLLNQHDIEPGDSIFIDTGVYLIGSNQVITALDGGDLSNRVEVIGSTNFAGGGTVFNRQDTNVSVYALFVSGAQNVRVSDITFQTAGTGLRVENVARADLVGIVAQNCASFGVHVINSSSVTAERVVATQCGSDGLRVSGTEGMHLNHAVLWRNRSSGLRVDSGTVRISNSVVVASGRTAFGYHAATATNILGDYNDIFVETNAAVGFIASTNRTIDAIGGWTAFSTTEVHSLSVDPLFFAPDSGNFHLKTAEPNGRFVPGLGFVGTDAETSPLIDAGHPRSAFSNEPALNGGRVNIGFYGNTSEASKGTTNARLHAASLRAGGWIQGTGTLHWVAANFTNSATVTVSVSLDGGESWSVLAAAVPATNESVTWNTLLTNDTPAGLWRVTSESDTNLFDQSPRFFAVRNTNLTIHVNDSLTAGDVYTSGAGDTNHWVASASLPMDSLLRAFDLYDLEPGDRVLVDTGSYSNDNIHIRRSAGGISSSWVCVHGSTNEAAGGSIIYRRSTTNNAFGLQIDTVQYMAISNLQLRGGSVGAVVSNANNVVLSLGVSGATNLGVVIRSSSAVALRHSVISDCYGPAVRVDQATDARILHSVLWSNVGAALVVTGSTVGVTNSVLQSLGAGVYVYQVSAAADLIRADYNDILAVSGAQVGRVGNTIYKFLSSWQVATSNDVRSLSHDPEFVSPATGDYHARSEAGRYTPSGVLVTDVVTSLLIDTGDPLSAFAAEGLPNGGRANIGLYGNTARASLSRTNGWLLALTLNDGGPIRGTGTLYWVAGGATTGNLVSIDYSFNGGTTWTNIATNVPATAGSVVWTSTPYGSSAVSKWRVISQTDTNVYDENDTQFILNNGAIDYYVNDASTSGDVYCTAIGSAANDGLTPSTPKASIAAVLSTYDFREGDRILVDTGLFAVSNTIEIAEAVLGGATNSIIIQGSTNEAAGGTRLAGFSLPRMFDIRDTAHIGLRDLTLSGTLLGVGWSRVTNTFAERVVVNDAKTAFEVFQSISNTMRGCVANKVSTGVFCNAGTAVRWLDGVIRADDTTGTCVRVDQGDITVSNSVLWASGLGGLAYYLKPGVTLVADYNDVYVTNTARAAVIEDNLADYIFESLSRWRRDTGRDAYSLSTDPGFADAASGNFYLLSQAGRYDPSSAAFVFDTNTSALVDAGDPAASYTNESANNGVRRNIGLHGDTARASRTPTNAAVSLISLNDGGRAEGTNVTLRWNARGAATNAAFRLEYSADAGSNWATIVSSVPALPSAYVWNTTSYVGSIRGLWRMVDVTNLQVVAQSERYFALRNTPIPFYVNDDSITGDVYAVAVGSTTNDGLSAATPMASVQQVIDTYDLEGGDVVYIDTGVYTSAAPLLVTTADSGDGTNRVSFIGSTNTAAGGTIMSRFPFTTFKTRGIELQHTMIDASTNSGFGPGVSVRFATNTLMRHVTVLRGDGFSLDRANVSRFYHCAAAFAMTNGLLIQSSGSTLWESGVLWSNAIYGMQMFGGDVVMSNSVAAALTTNSAVYALRASAVLVADYNDIYVGSGSYVGGESAVPLSRTYDNVTHWALATGRDRNSLSHDPRFAGPGIGDFHPRSEAGRYDPATEVFINDPETSPLIDAGQPSATFSSEPMPNGQRVNMGMWANTEQASKTQTNGSLTVVSFNDGGIATGTNVTLSWIARAAATGQQAVLEFSPDGGQSWQLIASNVNLSAGFYTWNILSFTTTPRAVWRITSQSDTNASDQSDEWFVLRNQPISFYVNDGSTNGDVYAFATGHATNTGLTAADPLSSVSLVLDAYDLEPGDTVYVDTGVYSLTAPTRIDQADGSAVSNDQYVVFQGSTNTAKGGTRIIASPGEAAFWLEFVASIELRNFTILADGVGVFMDDCYLPRLESVRVSGGTSGFDIRRTEGAILRRCAVHGAAADGIVALSSPSMSVQNSVFWSNGMSAIRVRNSTIACSNSVIGVFGSDRYAYSIEGGGIKADYNAVYLANNASAAFQQASPIPQYYLTLSRWRRDYTQDIHSLTHNPLFASPGAGDFHLQSQAGRYVPTNGIFVQDLVTSPLIDAGDPTASFEDEGLPNGSRLNIGLYGDTGEASLTPTNASLTAVALNDGGRVEGTNAVLYWIARGDATGHLVRLDFSGNGGGTWQTIATNLPATNAAYVWNTLSFTSTMQGVWRVASETDTNVYDQTDVLFALRNSPLAFYVNDGSTAGDVYATAAGVSTNLGILPSAPLNSIQAILNLWDLELGDTVYVDTGTYNLTSGISIDRFDAGNATGASTDYVTLQGSTNACAGGTLLNMLTAADGITATLAPGIALRDLRIRNASRAVRFVSCDFGDVQYVIAERCAMGFHISESRNILLRNCASVGATDRGLFMEGSSSSATWLNGILWSNLYGVLQVAGSLKIRNSIIGQQAPGSFAYRIVAGTLDTDYNNITLSNSLCAVFVSTESGSGGSNRIETLAQWAGQFGHDEHSIEFEPVFVNAPGGDYRLKTTRPLGRFDPCTGWTNDNASSLLIDTGDPSYDSAAEPMENGGRINIDLYGGTWQATKTPSQGWLSWITPKCGDVFQGTNVGIQLFAGWVATGHTVCIDYSGDDGFTWTNIVCNWPASIPDYIWNSEPYGRSALSRLRITSEVDPTIIATSCTFVLKNGGTIPYYVNDTSTVGDVYCTTPGSRFNSGLKPSEPRDSIQSILTDYILGPVDTIYVDTGHYSLTNAVTITDLDDGTATGSFVIVQGSTNAAAGGTILDRQTGGDIALRLAGANGIILRSLRVRNAASGVRFEGGNGIHVHGLVAEENSVGFDVVNATLVFSNCVARDNSSNGIRIAEGEVDWNQGVVWDNPVAVSVPQGEIHVRNSIMQADGFGRRIYSIAGGLGTLTNSDYNNLVHENGALVAEISRPIGGNDLYDTVFDWSRANSQDQHSLSHDPLFASEPGGDYHLRSVVGRSLPGSGTVTDTVHSALIDAGDPAMPFASEPDPDGSRANIGAFGNTPEASLSRTGAWITAVSLNEGVVVRGTATLYWVYGNIATGESVRLEASTDGGIEYSVIASNVPVTSTGFTWDACSYPLTTLGRWKVVLQSNTNVADEVDELFAIKCGCLTIYVNDTNLVGDVYSTAPGSPLNDGLSPSTPLDEPATALRKYPLGACDEVFIDTGYYYITNTTGMRLSDRNRGVPGSPLRIIGSSNELYGGTIIDRFQTNDVVFQLSRVRHVVVENLKLQGGSIGLQVDSSALNAKFRWVSAISNSVLGIYVSDSFAVGFSNCAAWKNGGWGLTGDGSQTDLVWRSGVIWSNGAGGVRALNGTLFLEDSIVGGGSPTSFVMEVRNGTVRYDYNIYEKHPLAPFARDSFRNLTLAKMSEWQDEFQTDAHSVLQNPLFGDAGAGDFHLRSEAGRYSNGVYVLDVVTSWAIDAGDPAKAFSAEPAPNGARLNAGQYGNTATESRSRTSPSELLAGTLNDGGTVDDVTTLYWLTRGMSATSRVMVEFSPDGGLSWSNIASDLPALSGSYDFSPCSVFSPSPIGRWRVVDQGNTNLWDASDTNFVLRCGPINYYVNDTSTVGDVYSLAPGSSTNTGLDPSSPLLAIQDIINLYDLAPGDRVFIDTGVYILQNNVSVGALDSGACTSRVTFIGSTNGTAGGTVIRRVGTNAGPVGVAFSLQFVQGMGFEDLIIENADVGIDAVNSSCIAIDRSVIRDGGQAGVRLQVSSGNRIDRTIITRHTGSAVDSSASSFTMDGSILWSNQAHGLLMAGSFAGISNSVLHAFGVGRYCIQAVTNNSFRSDFNDFHAVDGALIAEFEGVDIEGLPQWSSVATGDIFSLTLDPLFANPASNDFHLRSETGRFSPTNGGFVTTDTNTSWLIDTGARYSPFTNEPAPNGGRLNMGRYGNTAEASKSRTNSTSMLTNKWLLAIRGSGGGRLEGNFDLTWAYGSDLAATNRVLLDYSFDNGVTWTNIGTSQVDTLQYFWLSASQEDGEEKWPSSPIARWRIVDATDTNLYDVTDEYFSLRNHPFIFYVNDTSTVGDVYSTAPGSCTNNGLFPYSPMASLECLLASLDVEGEDEICMDTGLYTINTNDNVELGVGDQGKPGLYVLIRGSTNLAAGGTQIIPQVPGATLLAVQASHVKLERLMFSGGNLTLAGIGNMVTNCSVTNGSVDVSGIDSLLTELRVRRGDVAIVATNSAMYRTTVLQGGVTMNGASLAMENCLVVATSTPALTLASAPNASIRNNTLLGAGTAIAVSGIDTLTLLENNILVADGSYGEAFCIRWDGGLIDSDYNVLLNRNGAWIGNRNGHWERLAYWQRESGEDLHSVVSDPYFANEAGFDFHVKSVRGRYAGGVFVTDAVHSVAIDAGNPLSDYFEEPMPNAARINAGAYANTEQASLSRTNRSLTALALNDGGAVKGTVSLQWRSTGMTSNDTVTLQYSPDGGSTWTNIVSGLNATNVQYSWNSTSFVSSLDALWRVVDGSNTGLLDQGDSGFYLRNVPLSFYVNDASMVGDVFTTTNGSPAFNGLTPQTPSHSIHAVLTNYDLEGMDVLYIDTGVYAVTSDVTVIWSDGGDTNGHVIIRGSTNFGAGGSVFVRGNTASNSDAFDIKASRIWLRDLAVRDAYRGVHLESNRLAVVDRLLIYSNEIGVFSFKTQGATNRNLRLWNNRQGAVDIFESTTSYVENCTFVGNAAFGIRIQSSLSNVIQNNIFYLTVTNSVAMLDVSNNAIDNAYVDYNVYYFTTNNEIYPGYTSLTPWQRATSNDFRSAITNPLFQNVAAGDFHLKSQAGRYQDSISGFTNDTVTSWAVDAGNPFSSYTNEPATNGSRVNIGAYGNTEYASKGTTNVGVFARVLNDPTTLSTNDNPLALIWSSRNAPTGATVRIEYSGDGGLTWVALATNIPTEQEFIIWSFSPLYNTYNRGQWRVVGEGANPYGLGDTNNAPIDLFFGEFEIANQVKSTNQTYNTITWRGAWGESYQVQYAETRGVTNRYFMWTNAMDGAGPLQDASFQSTVGGDFTYEDPTSTGVPFRIYRVILNQYE